jgi:lipopolysaccharide export system permease protein
MRILSRYVFRQTAGALLLIVLSLTGVTWIAVALRQLELLTSQGQDALRFLAMTTLAIPSMMALIAPIALVIAALYVLNRLSGDSELIVMTAGGMPTWALFKPLAMVALLVATGVSVVNHLAGPWAAQKLKELVVQVRTDLMSQVIQPWRFTSPEAKMTVHIRDRSPSGDLLGLLMHDGRDPKQIVTYLAERGQIIKQAGAAYLRMEKGHIIRRLPNEPAPQIVAFEGYAVDLNQLEQRAEPLLWLKARERYTTELLWPNTEDPMYKANPGSFTAELHERFSAPLYAFMFVLLVLAFMGQAQTTRTTRMQALVSAFTIAIGCRILGIGAANAVVSRPALSSLLYAVPIGAGLAAAMAVHWRMYPRPPTRIARALHAVSDRVGGMTARLWAATEPPSAPSRMRG